MFKVELTAVENLLAALAKVNNGHYIDPRTVSIMSSRAFRTRDTDTLTILQVKGTRGSVDYLEVKHNKVPINHILPEVLEVEPSSQVNTSELLRDVVVKYGIALSDADIVVKKINDLDDTHQIHMVANHPIWTGFIEVRITEPASSLLSSVTNLSLILPEEEDSLKKDARLMYYGYEFTELSKLITELEVGDGFDTEFRRFLNSVVTHKWVSYSTNRQYNVYGGEVVYNGSTDGFFGRCNKKYLNVMVFKLGSKCSNLKGELFFHYN